MEYITLKDIAIINMGQSPDSKTYNEEKEGIPFYQGKSDFGKINPIPRVWCSNPIKIAEKEDILISVRAPIGDTNIATERCCIGRGLASIRPLNENVNQKYLYYLLNSKYKELNKFGTGSTFKAITKDNLCNLKCTHIPDIKEQIEVVKKLDNVSQIIEIKKEQLEQLNTIIKSQFVEMFENEKYIKIKLGEEFDVSSGGTPSKNKEEYWNSNDISWIGSNMCQNKIIYENDGKYISYSGLKHSSAKIYPIDTVLVALVGATIGKTALLKFETATNQNIAGIQVSKRFNAEYVYFAIQNLYYKFTELSKGTFKMANLSFVRDLEIPMPPIELQYKFADIVKQIDKQKFEIENSLKEMQELYESLMKKYFG